MTDELSRGAVIVTVVPGEYGKPRPAVVVQDSRLTPLMESVVVALLTTSDRGGKHIRVKVEPTAENALHQTSRIMVDKVFSIHKHRVSQVIGQMDDATMRGVDEALRTVFSLANVIDIVES